MRIKSGFTGLIFILIGLICIGINLVSLNEKSTTFWSTYWPSYSFLLVSFILHLIYLFTTGKGRVYLLIPAGVLLALGIIFQYAQIFDAWHYIWPFLIFAPAVGLLELYFFGSRQRWVLLPIFILTTISVVFLSIFTFNHLFEQTSLLWIIATVFIVVGIISLFRNKKEIA